MGASRRTIAFLVVGAATAAACDGLLGLGDYSKVACAFDCGVDASEAGAFGEASEDSGSDMADASHDAREEPVVDAADEEAMADVQEIDAGFEEVEPTRRWAQWPMPNPDAAIAPDASTLLPNTMSYDAGADGGSKTAYDRVTHLTWWRAYLSASFEFDAETACTKLGSTWRVPTRIELVSLVDFTQSSPTIDPATFPNTPTQRFWSSSSAPAEAGVTAFWVVDFLTGLATIGQGSAADYVFCVSGP